MGVGDREVFGGVVSAYDETRIAAADKGLEECGDCSSGGGSGGRSVVSVLGRVKFMGKEGLWE